MHQKDKSIIQRSNIQTDAIVINQCDNDSIENYAFKNNKNVECNVSFINTTERGLSRSRNMAIRYATDADICLICDDDEYLMNDYEDIILSAYAENPKANLIAFSLIRKDVEKKYPIEKKILKFKQILKTSSVQITFKLKPLNKHGISFDEEMGSGTGNGGGEENKFLLDCKRKKIEMFYFPYVIATINTGQSQWFYGYTNEYFKAKGWSARRIFGGFTGLIYIFYFTLTHRNSYKNECTYRAAVFNMLKGWKSKR